MLIGFAGFFVLLGVIFVMMGSRAARADAGGRRIPHERVQLLAIGCFIVGVGLLAWFFYRGAFG